MSFGATQWFWALARSAALSRPLHSGRTAQRDYTCANLFRRDCCHNLPVMSIAHDARSVLLSFCFRWRWRLSALAKPRWGYIYEDVKRRGLDLLFAIDTSRSMLSNDVAPNRLERVKLAAQDLITELQGDRVGLIAFAGRAFLQAPLTIDYEAAVESINDLDTKTIPEGGTNISEAIALAIQTFGKSAMGNRALIIFTDGEELSGDAVRKQRKRRRRA